MRRLFVLCGCIVAGAGSCSQPCLAPDAGGVHEAADAGGTGVPMDGGEVDSGAVRVDGGEADSAGFGAGKVDDGGGDGSVWAPEPCGSNDGGLFDASVSDGTSDGGCWTVPGFDDCAGRCGGGAVAAMGELVYGPWNGGQSCAFLQACSCEFGTVDLTEGCASDSDCMLVGADTCSCTASGASIALPRANVATWNNAMRTRYRAACMPAGSPWAYCFYASVCTDAGVACVSGHCRLQ